MKNADTAEQKGYDAGKKVSGIKIHITVDVIGLPHAVHLSAVKNFLFDGGYSGKNFADSVKDIHGATVEVVKKSDLPEFTVIPKRWIVERTFAWLEKNRRLWL